MTEKAKIRKVRQNQDSSPITRFAFRIVAGFGWKRCGMKEGYLRKYMENPWAIGGFISAISPNLIAFAYVLWHYVLQHILQPGNKSDMDFFSGSPLAVLPLLGALLLGFLFVPRFWTMLLGTISVVLSIIAKRRNEMGGERLAGIALALGTIEIAIVGFMLLAKVLI